MHILRWNCLLYLLHNDQSDEMKVVKYNDIRLNRSSTDKRVASICVIFVSATDNQRHKSHCLVSDCPRILENDIITLGRTAEVEAAVIERQTQLPIDTTSILVQPETRCAADVRIWRCQERLSPGQEGQSNDIHGNEDN
jgi:hypothetical protein